LISRINITNFTSKLSKMFKSIILSFLLFLTCSNLIAQDISVEKIWKNYEFYPRYGQEFNSMSDGISYTVSDENYNILKYNIEDLANENNNGKPEIIFTAADFSYSEYEFNSDESKILFLTNYNSIYRYSYSAVYYLYDRNTKKLERLDEMHEPQTLAEYSPDGKFVSYVHKNNIYIKEISSGKISQLTEDGKRNKIINGTTDWVYEEEFAITKAYDWSPDSKYIAFLKFNEKEVKQFRMTFYNGLYPDSYKFKYPKAGEDNSLVSVHLIDLGKKKCKIKSIDIGEYEYIPRIQWAESSNKLILQSMNRHQNSLKYHLIDCTQGSPKSSMIFEEKSDTYIDVDDNLIFLDDGSSLLRTSEIDGFKHIYRLDFSGDHQQITKGDWDVIDVLGLEEGSNTIYYSSSEPHATQKSIYAIKVNGSDKIDLTPQRGYNSGRFLNGMKYFSHTYSNANTPPVHSLRKNDGSLVVELEDNSLLKNKIESIYTTTPKRLKSMDLGYTSLNTWMILPHDFDSTKKYPVYFRVYGGPGHNEVLDSYDRNYMYHQLLAQEGYIVFSVDPRGTMYRGSAFKKSTYLELGKLEIEDIMNAAIKLREHSWVDPDRIGIMGWSYGGFMSSLAITKGADIFKMAIAVAPVTNWRFYDNIYTERFMRTPEENESGYDENSPINHVEKMKGNYLLIHGSADDNVHYQNTMEMINAMVAADKQFDLFIYPNKNHGIYGGNTRNHLFQMMFNYIKNNL